MLILQYKQGVPPTLGNVYFGGSNGAVVQVDQDTGNVTNQINLGSGGVFQGGLYFDGTNVFANSSTGYVYKFDKDLTTTLWESPVNYGGSSLRSIAVDKNGDVYIAGTFDTIKRLRGSDGVETWESPVTYTFTTPTVSIDDADPPLVAVMGRLAGQDTLQVFESGGVVTLMSTTGGSPLFDSNTIGFVPNDSPPAIITLGSDTTSGDLNIRKVNTDTSLNVWNVDMVNRQGFGPDIGFDSGGNIYGITTGPTPDKVTKWSGSNGSLSTRWSTGNLPRSIAVATTDFIYVGCNTGVYEKYNTAGGLEWSKTLTGLPTMNGVAVVNWPNL